MSNSLAAESVLANVREEIREEVAYALELASRVGQGANAYTAEGKETRDDLKSLLTQAQARATAAEGEMLNPVEPNALAHSIATLDRCADLTLIEIDEAGDAINFGESVLLVLHELKRLRAAQGEMPSRKEMEAALAEKLRQSGGAFLSNSEVADAILALRKPSSAESRATRAEALLRQAEDALLAFVEVGDRKASRDMAASFLSSLSHQDEQG